VCVGKIALFDKALASAVARGALTMCAMRVGVPFFFCGWEKNKINSSNLHCPIKKLNPFYFQFITIVSVCRLSLSGNSGRLLRPRPLRTVRETFTSYGSGSIKAA